MAKTKSTTKVEFDAKDNRDDLLTTLQTEINKSSKDGKVAHFLDEQDDPSTITDWISTGSSMLDLAISNRPHGGLPVGRMVEFNGLEGTGKSLLSAHIVANTQKKGGVAVVIDTENAAAPEFWASLGVDLKNLLYIQSDTVEDVFEKMENIIAVVRKSTKKRNLTIIVDSVAGVSTKAELESDHGKDGWSTGKAIIIGKAMRKITSMVGRQQVLIVFTNQLRQNLNAAMFGDKWIVSGGKALAFHCSVRVRLANAGMLKRSSDKVVIGNKCKAKVVKNRMGPPQRQAEFDIYHDSGIADYGSWLEVMKAQSIVTYSTPNYTYRPEVGEPIKFTAKDFVNLMSENEPLREELYSKICSAVIMKYKDPNSKIVEDATVDTDEDGVADTDE